MWQVGQARAGGRLLGRMSGITAKSASVAAFHRQEQGVCGPALSGELQEPRARDTLVGLVSHHLLVFFLPAHIAVYGVTQSRTQLK